MKRFLCICLSFFMLAVMFVIPLDLFPSRAEQREEERKNHFVILFDVSGSMLDVDPEYQARNTISRFVSCIAKHIGDIKLTVIPFSTTCSDGFSIAPDEMVNGAQEKFNEKLGLINYVEGAYTNIGVALERCNEILKKTQAGENPCMQSVLFITDGVIRMPGDGSEESEIKNTIESYEKAIKAAGEFPSDVCFLGVIPEVVATKENSEQNSGGAPKEDGREDTKERIEYDETGTRVLRYANIEVPEKYQGKMVEVAHWSDKFCETLNVQKDGQPKRKYPAECKTLNWSDGENYTKELEDFFLSFIHKVWDANTTKKEDKDLAKGYSIQIPESTKEADISITPKAETTAERRALVQALRSRLTISKEQSAYEDWELLNAIDTATVKLVDPEPGVYTLQQMDEKSFLVDMSFIVYGGVNVSLEDDHLEGILGEPLTIAGSVVGQNQEGISEASMRYIQPDFVFQSADGNPLDEQIQVSFEKSGFTCTYTPTSVGQFQINLGIEYNDTNEEGPPAGISHYGNRDAFVTVTIPEVEYTPSAARDTDDPSKATVSLAPFSTISGQRVLVNASSCQAYLQDQWVLSCNGEEMALAVSSDGKEFLVEIESLQAGAEEATLHNQTSGQDISIEIPPPLDPLQKTDQFCEKVHLFWMPGSGCSRTLDLDKWFASNGNVYSLDPGSSGFSLTSTDNGGYRLQYKGEHNLHLWPEEKTLSLAVSNSHSLANEEYSITVLDFGLLFCAVIAAAVLLILILVFIVVKNHNTAIVVFNINGSVIKKRIKKNGSYVNIKGFPKEIGSNLRVGFDTYSNRWHYIYTAHTTSGDISKEGDGPIGDSSRRVKINILDTKNSNTGESRQYF